ncbi:hypothetical protein F0310_05270, partial (plasmid) [Borrelia sp. A-FGy1]|uniref:hypothetical protein n=1 Tax=Borrelia sp. A-FGy1 TaxID=2608247 RepID=UPI0015F60BD7
MRVRVLFLSLFMFISINALSGTTFELNLGIGLDIPVSTISNLYNTTLGLGNKLKTNISAVKREQIVKEFSDMVNMAKAGLNYGGHAQMGARLNDLFSLGFELGFDFNVFYALNRSGQLNDRVSFIGSLEPRIYTKLAFFTGSAALFTGPRLSLATLVKDSILDEFGIFSRD